MTPEDMAALHARCFPDRPWSAAEIAALLASDRVINLPGPSGDSFLLARVIAPEAEILTIAVAPETRRQGKGAALVQALLDEMATGGVETLFLEVAASNDAARGLYAKLGFRETGRRKGYYRLADGSFADAVLMQRDLTQGQPAPGMGQG